MAAGGTSKTVKAVPAKVARPSTKKSPTTATRHADETADLKLQQRCLDVFRLALHPSRDDRAILQEVKGFLYSRDFHSAFGKEEYLRVYASRWSPSRALAYTQVFNDLEAHLSAWRSASSDDTHKPKAFKTVCLGGGAGAELVGLAGWLSRASNDDPQISIDLHLLDMADWQSVVTALVSGITTPPVLSKYASSAVKESNAAMLPPTSFEVSFSQRDVLDWPDSELMEMMRDATLVTLLFTLNELYSTSIPKTQRLLSQLTASTSPGCLLLVVDSPGSYSSVSINGAQKKYPMQWLLDVTLLGKAGQDEAPPRWEKLVEDESRWFRMPAGLQYPIELENMRYQIHLFRRLGQYATS